VQSGDGDLVITDVVMPDENAFELLPRIADSKLSTAQASVRAMITIS
jgi:DNA-binding NarL/FixJ family response regulator